MECWDDLAGVEGGGAVWIAMVQVLEEKIRLRKENEEDRELRGLKQEGGGRGRRRGRGRGRGEGEVVRRKQPRWRRRIRKRGRSLLGRDGGSIGAMGMNEKKGIREFCIELLPL